MPKYKPHRFSGYPGAICYDCGCEDKREICITDHHVSCPHCQCGCLKCGGTGMGRCDDPSCENTSCPGCPECGRYGFEHGTLNTEADACMCGRPKLRSK